MNSNASMMVGSSNLVGNIQSDKRVCLKRLVWCKQMPASVFVAYQNAKTDVAQSQKTD